MEFIAHEYQNHAIEHVVENEACGLFLDMGLGKSVATLTAIDRLMYDTMEVSRVLVIAPKRVAENTWTGEVGKWDHLKHLRVSVVLGDERHRREALRSQADIYVINRENVAWLVAYYQAGWPFDMVVIDELSSFKSAQSVRFKALKRVRPLISRVVGLTGTPAPNGLIDLWPQLYLLDRGERLGKTITGFRQRYFTPGRGNGTVVFDYKPRQDTESLIYDRIGDICISMKAEDYLELPARIDRTVEVVLPPEVMAQYQEFERKQILALEETQDISAVNAAALSGKLLQFANGAVYDADKAYHEVHDAKLEALQEIVEAACGRPVLVFYSFKHDLERIRAKFERLEPRVINTPKDIEEWNQGRIRLLLAHPASAGHGLNLQAGGNIVVWFGLNWSLELYQQANARLHRQGQTKPVIIHHLVASGTIDGDVVKALSEKADTQDALMEAVRARVGRYRGER